MFLTCAQKEREDLTLTEILTVCCTQRFTYDTSINGNKKGTLLF